MRSSTRRESMWAMGLKPFDVQNRAPMMFGDR
jgi:hypothetical protein